MQSSGATNFSKEMLELKHDKNQIQTDKRLPRTSCWNAGSSNNKRFNLKINLGEKAVSGFVGWPANHLIKRENSVLNIIIDIYKVKVNPKNQSYRIFSFRAKTFRCPK